MAKSLSHIQQWKHNRSLLSLMDPAYPDWIVTIAFYVALHAVDALLMKDGIPCTSHENRNGVLSKTHKYQAIWAAYQPLYGLSRTVRYMADPQKWITIEDIGNEVFRRYLYPVEKSVQNLLKQNLGLPLIALRALPPAPTATAAPAPPPTAP